MRSLVGKALDESIVLGRLESQLNRQCAKVRATFPRIRADPEYRRTLLLELENIYSRYEVAAGKSEELNRVRRHRRRYLSAHNALKTIDQNV